MLYRKKPVAVEAFKLDKDEKPNWFLSAIDSGKAILNEDGSAEIITLEGTHHALPTDFIIKGVKGELYPCKADIFDATYETAE